MSERSGALRDRLVRYGQEHLLGFEAELAPDALSALHAQIDSIDFERLRLLFQEAGKSSVGIDAGAIAPFPIRRLPRSQSDLDAQERARRKGMELIEAGKVGVVLVAGGQGSRLGFEHPKGMFPIGPVRDTSLFQIFAETILAWRRQTRQNIPWYIMTSPTNRAETADYFESHRYFGLPSRDIRFFEQGTMPAVDHQSGRVLLAEKGSLFTSPNGHGGMLLALRDEGVLDELAERGIDLVYYFQVDNPLAAILDPVFIGHHALENADVSVKVVRKKGPEEKMGVVVDYQGNPTIIEYSDLPRELAHRTTPDGELAFWAGSIAIHVFSRPFLECLTAGELALPFHFARKKVPYVDATGRLIEPTAPNAIKFELFIFDVLPLAERVVVVETDRQEEFFPVKNASGDDSPAVAKAAMVRQAAQWLRQAGVAIPTNSAGEPAMAIEISPLAGLSADDFSRRLRNRRPIDQPRYFSEEDCPMG